MFNFEDYNRRIEDLKFNLRADYNGKWRDDVDLRYGRFLVENARKRIVAGQTSITEIGHTEARHYLTADLRDIAGIIYNASNLIAGNVKVADPEQCEAELRLFAEANRAQDPPAEVREHGQVA